MNKETAVLVVQGLAYPITGGKFQRASTAVVMYEVYVMYVTDVRCGP